MKTGTIFMGEAINMDTGSPAGWVAQVNWTNIPHHEQNTSTVKMTIQIKMDSNYYLLGTWEVGVSVYSSHSGGIPVGGSGKIDQTVTPEWETLYSVSFDVEHNENGECFLEPVISVARWGNEITSTTRYDVMELESTIKTPEITVAPNFTDEDEPEIRYENLMKNNGVVSSLQVCIANETGGSVYVPYRDVSLTGTQYTFELTDAERKNLRRAAANSTTLPVRYYIKSIVKGEEHRTSLPATMSIIDAEPHLEMVLEDVNSITTAVTHNETMLVKGMSNVSFVLFPEAMKEATVKSFYIKNGARKVENQTSGTFESVESPTFYAGITDSRGLKHEIELDMDMIDYVKLTCNQTVKLLLDGNDGGQISLSIEGNCYRGGFGPQAEIDNFLKLEVKHTQNDGTMGEWVDLTPLMPEFSNNAYYLHATLSGFDVSGAYTFQCRATDALGNVVTNQYQVKFTPVFSWSKTDFAFNVPVSIDGYTLLDYVIEQGTEPMGTNGTWYWTKWKSGKAECYGTRNFGRAAINHSWGNLFESDEYTQDFPSGLFVEKPDSLTMTLGYCGSGAMLERGYQNRETATNTGSFLLVRPTAIITEESNVSFHAIGRWKY